MNCVIQRADGGFHLTLWQNAGSSLLRMFRLFTDISFYNMRYFSLYSRPLCGISVQEHFQIASHATSAVLGAGDSERQDRSSQSVGKIKKIRYFGGRKIMCRGLLGGWGVEINKA